MVGKKYVIMIVRGIRTENFSLREIGTWEKVRCYLTGINTIESRSNVLPGGRKMYVVMIVRCIRTENFHYAKSGPGKKDVITVDTL